MTITAPDTTTTGTLTLTSIRADHPLLARAVRDWTDQEQVHKAIMALFPPHLDGDRGQRRATAGILYRLEHTPTGCPRVLLQHRAPLRAGITGVPSVALRPLMDRLEPGTLIRFRTDLNAVVVEHQTQRRHPITNSRLTPGQPVPEDVTGVDVRDHDDGTRTLDRLTPHLRTKLGGALTGVTVPTEPTVTVRRAGRQPLHTVRYDGWATVADPERLGELLTNGVGRAKAYGCGLLSVAVPGPA